jgi:AraC family transcriptional regulator, glycine betaine-responsive activator
MDGDFCINGHSVARDWIAVLILDGFSVLSLGAITEPFEQMRLDLPDLAPELRLTGLTSRSVLSASGVEVACGLDGTTLENTLFSSAAPQAIIICGPTHTRSRDESFTPLLRKAKRSGAALYGIGSVAWSMADAGLLTGKTATVHWKSLTAFCESSPLSETSNSLYVTSEQGGSCAGELATLDMIINMITARAPHAAEEICNHLLVSHPRMGSIAQPGSQQERLRHVPPTLSQAARLMAGKIEAPLTGHQVAAGCRVSLRQLERLFRKHLRMSPMQYYTDLKVERALELVSQTDLPLEEVAIASGFTSSGMFSKKFKKSLGITPTQFRKERYLYPAHSRTRRF